MMMAPSMVEIFWQTWMKKALPLTGNQHWSSLVVVLLGMLFPSRSNLQVVPKGNEPELGIAGGPEPQIKSTLLETMLLLSPHHWKIYIMIILLLNRSSSFNKVTTEKIGAVL